jgi:hypothetical protein
MLTSDEIRLAAHATALRIDEQPGHDVWFAPAHELRPEAHGLVLAGYLDYRTDGDGIVYRLTDQAVAAQGLPSLTAGQCQN